MIEKIIEYSIRNRFLVLAGWILVAVWGVHSVIHTPVDAIPDLSENQVIVFTDWMGRSPREIEDQVTYPLSVNLQGLAGVKTVRSSSEFNFSMINIIFEDDVDFYFARERVLERLTLASTFLPQGVVPYLAPDATALGQIFWYTLEGANQEPGRLRALQDWYVRYQLNSVPGVAQCASVGGYPIEYQIDVDPVKLRSYGVTLGEVFAAVSRSNSAVGGRVVHKGNAEYLIRGVGWIRTTEDIENIVVRTDPARGTPIYVSNVASVSQGPQFRRSVLEKNGDEVTGGVVLMRFGENPLEVTRRIKQKIQQLQPGLPEGVRIVPFYDRTRLIEGAIETLTRVLEHEIVIASIAILLILGHFRSAFVICVTLPMSVLISFILMRRFGIASNIMSLSGIAISIGILVDQAIVMVENATHHLTEHFQGKKIEGDTRELVIPACRTVGRPIFFSVLIILLSFVPVFALGGQEGKTFHPLAFTKTFAMIGVAILSITLVPALIPSFIRGKLKREEESWLVKTLIDIYKPVLSWAVDYPRVVNWFFVVLLAFGWHLWGKIGREYMPPLDEGSILDMPVTVPRASVAEVADDLKARDALTRRFPEVEMGVGKAGRADTPTDPSPLDMVETVVDLRPKDYWPRRGLRYEDAKEQVARALAALEAKGFVELGSDLDRKGLVDVATMGALGRFDAAMRDLVRTRHVELEARLGPEITKECLDELLARFRSRGRLLREPTRDEHEKLVAILAMKHGSPLALGAAQEDVTKLLQEAAEHLDRAGVVKLDAELLALAPSAPRRALIALGEVLGRERPTLFTEMLAFAHERLDAHWKEAVQKIDWEAFDSGVAAFDWCALEELSKEARARAFATSSPSPAVLQALRAELDAPFAKRVFLWKKTKNELVKEMDSLLQVPGWGNIWTQPIINRIDMLATGVRTMIGVKVFGKDLDEIQRVSDEVARVLKEVPGAVDVFPDQNAGKGYIEVTVDRKKAARYGVNVGDVQDVIEVALGGKAITQTVEGRERFPVRVRYARDWREDEQKIANLLVNAGAAPESGQPLQIPLSMVADIRVVEGPAMIKSENGLLRSYVQLNVRDRDIVGFVEDAQRVVDQKVKPNMPSGMFLEWSGQFEHQVRARQTLQVVFPAVIVLIFLILYFTYNDFMDAVLMMMAVPEALVGGIFLLWLTGTNFSVAVWVGFIACFGMATETGIIMLVYLREAIERKGGLEKIASLEELQQTIIEGAVHRLRPKLLTEGVAIVSLAPMLWASGVGHEVISAMAAPVLGGLLISDEVVDIFIPVRFYWVRRARWLELHGTPQPKRPLLLRIAAVIMGVVALSGCATSLGGRPSDIEAARSRLDPLPGSGDPIDAILRAPPSDPRLDEALARGPTLEVVQETAVRRNPNLKAALERWVAFLERPMQKIAPAYPAFGYRYSSMFKMMEYGVALGVPFPGKLVTEARAALADADAVGADYRATENTLRSQAAGAYAALYLARRQVEIVDENLTLLARFIDVAQTKYRAGTATLPDVLRVETERENLLAEREILSKNVEIAASGLNVLLDRKPDEPIGKLPPLAEPTSPDELPALYDRALARRPELDAAKARAAASEYMISRGQQEWIPDLALGAAYVRDFGTQHNFVDLTAGVSIPWIFAPAIDARTARNMVLDEVKSSHARVEALAARYRRLTAEVVPRVRKNIDASEAAYAAGQVDFLSLIDTQRTLLSTLLDKEATLSEWTMRRAELTRAVGGATEDRP